MTNIPENTDELALRLARAHWTRTKGEEAPFTSLDVMSPGIAQVWRTQALTTYDVLGIEGTNAALSAMDNIAKARVNAAERIRRDDRVILRPVDAITNVFGGGPKTIDFGGKNG